MSVIGPDGKILEPGGGWWSPYGDTDEEIRENMKTGHMPNAPGVMHAGPRYFTGSKKGDDALQDFLDRYTRRLADQAKEVYEAEKKK